MRSRWFIAAALVLVGLVWIGQGSGFLAGSSFMVGDIRWAIAGVVMATIGLVIGALTIIRRPKV